jgi:hypothetical protein
MDKGIVVGVDQEISLRRNLDFAIFRIVTTVRLNRLQPCRKGPDLQSSPQTHLFLHHILRFHLDRSQLREAVLFASHYSHLIYFSHALEVLLHEVLEDEVEVANRHGVLPRVVEFLDHFEESLQVVVNCARKTEVTRWEFLFDVVGKPRDLFEVRGRLACLRRAACRLTTSPCRNASRQAFSKSLLPTYWSCTISSRSNKAARYACFRFS